MTLLVPKHYPVNPPRTRPQKDAAAAHSIAGSAKHRFDSDDFVSLSDVQDQLDELSSYIAERRTETEAYNLPMALGWKINMLVMAVPDKTRGGVIINDDARERRALSSPQGVILSIGPAAYTDETRFGWSGDLKAWVSVGDRILYTKHDARLFQLGNGQYVGTIVETDPLAIIDSGWEVPQ